MLKLMIRKYLQFYAQNICLSKPVFEIAFLRESARILPYIQDVITGDNT